jgi:hypothetical protein
MPRFGPIGRQDLIRYLRQIGFEGPYAGGRHQFMEMAASLASTSWRECSAKPGSAASSGSTFDTPGQVTMTSEPERERQPYERVHDIPLILEQMRLAVREALALHKRMGNPVAVWRDGKVEWIQPEDIPTDDA